jgi:hypothetical protein
MANGEQPEIALSRDGTSQSRRILRELDPDYARVDERTTRDLLAFAWEYSRELQYFGPDDPQNMQGATWRGFIAQADDPDKAAPELDAAARYAAAPETFSAHEAGRYSRPHFALFLAFLELLGDARAQLNVLTRRHLEFFYRDVLRMVRKQAVPDKVHVLVELDAGTRELRLPAGTALDAGKDSLGADLVYLTERELIANQAEVAQISSLRAETRITGIREASRQYRASGTPQEAFVAMLKMALGRPAPGDNFPLPPASPSIPDVTFEALEKHQILVEVVASGLGMPLFDDFRELMGLKRLRQALEAGEWKTINQTLENAGRRREATFQLPTTQKPVASQNSATFEANLEAVLGEGEKLAGRFDGLAEVNSVDEAYALLDKQPADPAVGAFITKALAPLSLEEFKSAMAIKASMDADWEKINRLLEGAAKRRKPAFEWPKDARASHDFDKKLADAGLDLSAGPQFKFAGDLEAYYAAFLAVEDAFYMSAENFKYIMSNAPRGTAAEADASWNGDKTYEILAAAHRKMIYERRRKTLREVAQASIARGGENPNVKALRDVLAVVMGNPDLSLDDALQKLGGLGVAPGDSAYLNDIKSNRVAAPDWARVAEVLEVAQRNRENLPAPVAQNVEWRNLYPAADARQVTALAAQPDAAALARWKTFGRGERALEQEPKLAPAASFGWAMTSPLLALGEGRRTIDLSLGFAAGSAEFDLGQNPFKVELSTGKGWLEPQSTKLAWAEPGLDSPKQGAAKLLTLEFTLDLSESQPALAPLARDVHGIDTSTPVLRLMVKPVWQKKDKCYVTSSYQYLRELSLIRARLAITVTGLSRLSLANDQGSLDAKKPFEPFGSTPAVGSRLYLGHPEVVGKKLDSLTFNIAWMGAPPDFARHYKNYSAKPEDFANQSFQVKVALAEGAVLRDFPSLTLFDTNAGDPVSIKLAPPADQGDPDNAGTGPADVTDWNRHLLWELTPTDFQHSIYTRVALEKALGLTAAVANAANSTATPKPAVSTADFQVNPPYTPKIKSLTLDYAASAELVLDAATTAAGALSVFHVEPFGYAQLKPGIVPGCPLLPKYDFAGELYIGLRNIEAPQNVSLLFQVAEGSANPDLASDPVRWSYLSGNEWLPMDNESLVADATRGFINSGIVELALKPALPSTRLLPCDLYWIRAAIAHVPDCVCDMVAIHPNAVPAGFADDGNAPDHLKAPLAPGRITGPAAPLPGVARILQPYSSFGGKMAEQDASFYVRVSERLRHKERALTAWDYERLVLEKFPQLYKVKCLRSSARHEGEPGKIELIVIPDIKNRLPFNPFEPKAPADLIRDIAAFLQDKTPPFARVEVKNAHYVPVKVRCGVRFMPGQDEGFCRVQLNDELNRFLSPWAYDEGADVVIGGSVYANSIINFIDSRDYVDYLAEFKLFTSEDGGRRFEFIEPPEKGGYHAGAKTPDGVLVAALDHEFDMISDADYRVERMAGLEYMRIELDFKVAETEQRLSKFNGIDYLRIELDFKLLS